MCATKLKPSLLTGFVALIVFAGGASLLKNRLATSTDLQTAVIDSSNSGHFESKEQEASGLCPWRNQAADMQRFFPGSTSATETSLVVSSQRLAVKKKLGRETTGDESALRAYKVLNGTRCVGVVVARRVKGQYGLIELVVAIDTSSNKILGAYVQRIREPEPASSALQNSSWLKEFVGKDMDSDWKAVGNSPALPASARVSAEAITDATRTVLVLFTTAKSIKGSVPTI